MKIKIDVNKMREMTLPFLDGADVDAHYTFYWDETNNFRKFYLKEEGFNYPFQANFVLGGLVYKGAPSSLENLFKGLKLQSNIRDIKLKHLAKGDLLQCLNSEKLNYFLKGILDGEGWVHYQNVNFLYYAIVDIVDSAIANSKAGMQLGGEFGRYVKNALYLVSIMEIDSLTKLFFHYGYPNIKQRDLTSFTHAISSLFEEYEDDFTFHVPLVSLRQMLREAEKEGSLPFIQNSDDHILMKDFSGFYTDPICLFKNSTHIFDNEQSINEVLSGYDFMDGEKRLDNFSFVTSDDNQHIHAADILVGFIGKFSEFINTNSLESIEEKVDDLNSLQKETLSVYFALVHKAIQKNPAFVKTFAPDSELQKTGLIEDVLLNSFNH